MSNDNHAIDRFVSIRERFKKSHIFPTMVHEAVCKELRTKPSQPLNRSVIDNVHPGRAYLR